ncbi:uncharacterized protein LOC131156669 [Malania oleifera]|uniref:uncharacterized protein LOC131156669 n=1 Tax=Malania oleifera TaxID=397392 RepID=UPI0025AE3103|nr:uncharacterized protein LOC131156669 [Malania oleifera]
MGNPGRFSSSGEDLHSAARAGDLNAVISICSSNPLSINSRDKHSRTPLHMAAWAGQTQVVDYLCKHKADVAAAAIDDVGAIHFAAQKGHLEVVRKLLSSGVSLKASTRKGLTPLHYAVQGSHLELVKYLVKKGASLSAKTKAGKTPVDLASSEEIRSFVVACEVSSKNGDLNSKEKAEDSDHKPSFLEKGENSVGENAVARHDEHDGMVKRKGDEDNVKEASSEPKKARVSLSHLLSADDTQEEENL